MRTSTNLQAVSHWSSTLAAILIVAAMAAADDATGLPAQGGTAIDFNRDVRAILSDKCFKCHGPDAGERQAGLRLDERNSATAELESGAMAIVPGDVERSELVRRIFAEDEYERMPPVDSQKSLSDREKELLKQWVSEGAAYETHWAFAPPQRPDVPAHPDDRWSRNEVDRFVWERLRAEGFEPSPEADRRTIVRRLSFDLTGLPPTIAEVDQFLADERPDAYERLVDRLLASPRFGERIAMHWLDLARYADTDGYEKDGHRQMWPYRDWVIKAINENKPFDEFTIEQLAGDLLPKPSRDQLIATAFNRNNPTTSEAGSDPEEFAAKYAVDRASTTASVWLALTMQCAECHDHKFDPVSTEDFYRLFAFFNQMPEIPLHEGADAPPSITVMTPEQESALSKLDSQISAAQQQLDGKIEALLADQPKWEEDTRAAANTNPDDSLRDELVVELAFDESEGSTCFDTSGHDHHGKLAGVPNSQPEAPQRVGELFGRGLGFAGNAHVDCGTLSIDVRKGLSYGAWVRPTQRGGVVLSKIDPTNGSRGFDLYLQEGQAIVHLIDSWPLAAFKFKTKTTYAPEQWLHVFVTWDGTSSQEAIRVYFNGELQPTIVDVNGPPVAEINSPAPLLVASRANGESAFHGQIDELRIYNRALTAGDVARLAARSVQRLLDVPSAQRTPEQSRILTDHYKRTAVAAVTASERERLSQLQQDAAKLRQEIPKVRVMQPAPEPKPTYILTRGDYRSPGKQVTPGIPAFLGSLEASASVDRLALARWLVSQDNPLTARVVVNRYWGLLFGTGLVSTANDFGYQGQSPSHPELLDWLAVEFAGDWDIKALLRRIVTSSTYRQSSRITSTLAERDRQNRLLARGPRQRLSAEMIRDNCLAISGLLQEQIGGPSVYPYHPAGLWEEMAWADSPWKTWPTESGPDLYRRGLYTFWKRSVLHPVLALFDAPTRNVCEVSRSTTNTPLQAFATLNETSFVEAARVLAARMMRAQEGNAEMAIHHGYLLAVARTPTLRERETLIDLYKRLREHYQQRPDDAAAIVTIGQSPSPSELDRIELAAWTCIAQVILNLDETITKE